MEKVQGGEKYLSQVKIGTKGKLVGPKGSKYKVTVKQQGKILNQESEQVSKKCIQLLRGSQASITNLGHVNIKKNSIYQGKREIGVIKEDEFQQLTKNLSGVIEGKPISINIQKISSGSIFQKFFSRFTGWHQKRSVRSSLKNLVKLEHEDNKVFEKLLSKDKKFVKTAYKYMKERKKIMEKKEKNIFVKEKEIESFGKYQNKFLDQLIREGVSEKAIQRLSGKGTEAILSPDIIKTYLGNEYPISYADKLLALELLTDPDTKNDLVIFLAGCQKNRESEISDPSVNREELPQFTVSPKYTAFVRRMKDSSKVWSADVKKEVESNQKFKAAYDGLVRTRNQSEVSSLKNDPPVLAGLYDALNKTTNQNIQKELLQLIYGKGLSHFDFSKDLGKQIQVYEGYANGRLELLKSLKGRGEDPVSKNYQKKAKKYLEDPAFKEKAGMMFTAYLSQKDPLKKYEAFSLASAQIYQEYYPGKELGAEEGDVLLLCALALGDDSFEDFSKEMVEVGKNIGHYIQKYGDADSAKFLVTYGKWANAVGVELT